MVKDEDVCLHCGLCAAGAVPTGAWDMQKYLIDMTYAEQACQFKKRKRFRRPVRQRQWLRFRQRERAVCASCSAHGRAVGFAQYFPSNIQGLPTWYEVRVSQAR